MAAMQVESPIVDEDSDVDAHPSMRHENAPEKKPTSKEDLNRASKDDSNTGKQKVNCGSLPEPTMMVQTKHGTQHLKDVVLDMNNWRAGVTVALVSVPLSISLGIASGTTPMRGVACAIFGGACAGIFGASDYNIVGPAGALSGMLMSYVAQWGEDVLPWISIFSSVIIAVFWLLRLDTYMLLMPTSVFEGFTVAVAIIIGLNQINFACGLVPTEKHKLFVMNIYASITELGSTKMPSLILFLIQTPVLWLLMCKFPKVPWTVIMPVVSIPLGWACNAGHLDLDLWTLKTKYGVLSPELVQPLQPLRAEWLPLFVASLSVAIVAVLETLISAKIAGTRVDRPFSHTGEMRGLTIAHAVCGVAGSMPPTGVFVRTALNTSLGATHRFSQVLNAAVVAIIAGTLMPLFSYLPQATIAALLVVASIRMVPWSYLMRLWHESKSTLLLCLITAAVCVGEDPVIGLVVGMVLALLDRAKRSIQAPSVRIIEEGGGAYRVAVIGALTYVKADTFIQQVKILDGVANVKLDLTDLYQLDHDGASALAKVVEAWMGSESMTEKKVVVIGVACTVFPVLQANQWFSKAIEEGRIRLCGSIHDGARDSACDANMV